VTLVKELGRLLPLGLLTLALAGCAMVNAATQPEDAIGPATIAQLRFVPQSAALVLVVNPSERAEDLEFEHGIEIVKTVASPNLTLVGLYEQETIDDGPPFDRPFLSTASPSVTHPPSVGLDSGCNGTTKFQRDTCTHKHARRMEQEVADLQTWRRGIDERTARWKTAVIDQINAVRANGFTEGDRSWNLRAVLLRAGQAMAADGRQNHCIVLLGGLAVRPPPADLPLDVLSGTKLVIAGWQGTQGVQDAWRTALSPAGVTPVFLPGTVTDLRLATAVTTCLGR
jgi:hypothetical protein